MFEVKHFTDLPISTSSSMQTVQLHCSYCGWLILSLTKKTSVHFKSSGSLTSTFFSCSDGFYRKYFSHTCLSKGRLRHDCVLENQLIKKKKKNSRVLFSSAERLHFLPCNFQFKLLPVCAASVYPQNPEIHEYAPVPYSSGSKGILPSQAYLLHRPN